jgi:hypothetical protein
MRFSGFCPLFNDLNRLPRPNRIPPVGVWIFSPSETMLPEARTLIGPGFRRHWWRVEIRNPADQADSHDSQLRKVPMTNMRSRFVLLLTTLFASVLSEAMVEPDSGRPSIHAVRVPGSITLTGRLDDAAWSQAVPVELNYEVTPGDNTPAPQRTLVRAMYDDRFLYFGFKCFDTQPEAIRANISDRDRMYQDDWVFVAIDTYGDYQRSYEFCVNPFGIQGDLLATINGEDENSDWIWHSAAEKNENGWTAEMAIPFSSLNFPDADSQLWRINLLRTIPRASRTQI